MKKTAMDEPTLRCYEESTKSAVTWHRSLNKGCLSKSLNRKSFLYGYTRAVAQRVFDKTRKPLLPPILPALVEDEEASQLSLQEPDSVSRIKGPPTSLVIKENLAKSPGAPITASCEMHFTADEFLWYMMSPDWSGSIRLRVMEGALLKLFQAALVWLERHSYLQQHESRAFMNNRIPLLISTAAEINEECTKPDSAQQSNQISFDQSGPGPSTQLMSDEEVVEDVSPKVEKLPLPKPYQTAENWQYEKLGVKFIYYESLPLLSSTVSQNSSDAAVPRNPQDQSKPTERLPMSLREYDMNKIRLPSYEDIQVPQTIADFEEDIAILQEKQKALEERRRLEAEEKAREAKEAKTKVGKDKQPQPPAKPEKVDKSGKSAGQVPSQPINPADVEWIAEDPYLVPEKAVAPPPSKYEAKKSAEKERTSTSPSKPLIDKTEGEKTPPSRASLDSKTSAEDVEDKASSKINPADTLASKEAQPQNEGEKNSEQASSALGLEQNKSPSLQDREMGSQPASRSISDGNDFPRAASLESDILFSGEKDDTEDTEAKEEKEEPKMKKLHLTGRELYVNGLYEPNERNREPVFAKLEKANKRRQKMHCATTRRIMSDLNDRARVDLASSFKHLARKKESERRKATAPRITTIKKCREAPLHRESLSSRQLFLEDFEACEMDAALNNELEAALLARLNTLKSIEVAPVIKDSEKDKGKKKSGKNRSQNRHLNDNTNSFGIEESCSSLIMSSCSSVGANSRMHMSPIKVGGRFPKQNDERPTTPTAKYTPLYLSQYVRGTGETNQYCKTLRKFNEIQVKNLHILPKLRNRNNSGVNTNGLQTEQTQNYRTSNYFGTEITHARTRRTVESDRNFSATRETKESLDNKLSQKQSFETKLSLTSNKENMQTQSTAEVNRSSSKRSSKSISPSFRSGESNEDGENQPSSPPMGEQSPQMTPSELFTLRLKGFDCQCDCEECLGDADLLRPLMAEDKSKLIGSYPVKLGELRKNFGFLRFKDYQHQPVFESIESIRKKYATLREPSVRETAAVLLQLMEDLIVRTEIIVSNVHQTFTTITFTKKSV